MRVLIVGCGYVGLPLGVELVRQRHEVFGVRRSAEAAEQLKASGIHPLVADVSRPETLRSLPAGFDWVVNLVSSDKGGACEYRAVYLEGTKNLIDWLAPTPPRKFVYTSSTGVYGQTDGSQVKETSPTEPAVETAQILVQTEKLLLEAWQQRKFPAVILRVAGIYGPERGHSDLKNLGDETVNGTSTSAYEFYARDGDKLRGPVRFYVAKDTGLPLRLAMTDPEGHGSINMDYDYSSVPDIEVPNCLK